MRPYCEYLASHWDEFVQLGLASVEPPTLDDYSDGDDSDSDAE